MSNPTTNYCFIMPTSTYLVTDLPADFDVFGQAVDTQMLTNANAAIAKAIVDAKGDIIAATAADTVSRLAVGANDTILTADSSTATGIKWAAPAVAVSGLNLVTTATISAATSISVNNCFTSTYANYLIIVDVPTTTGTAGYVTLRLRVSGTDTTTGYTVQNLTAVNTTVSGARGTVWEPFYAYPTDPGFAGTIELYRPNMAEKTFFKCVTGYGSDEEIFLRYGQQSASTQFDGFTLTGTGTLTGTIRVYGYQNS